MSVFKRSIVRKDKCGNPALITVPGRPIKIGLLGPPEARILDLAGPWEGFTRANDVLAGRRPDQEPASHLTPATNHSSKFIDYVSQHHTRDGGVLRPLCP